jgi:hypothetical protein
VFPRLLNPAVQCTAGGSIARKECLQHRLWQTVDQLLPSAGGLHAAVTAGIALPAVTMVGALKVSDRLLAPPGSPPEPSKEPEVKPVASAAVEAWFPAKHPVGRLQPGNVVELLGNLVSVSSAASCLLRPERGEGCLSDACVVLKVSLGVAVPNREQLEARVPPIRPPPAVDGVRDRWLVGLRFRRGPDCNLPRLLDIWTGVSPASLRAPVAGRVRVRGAFRDTAYRPLPA